MTDASGQAVLTIEVPDMTAANGIVLVGLGRTDGETIPGAMQRWRSLAQAWQFPAGGVALDLAAGQTEAFIEVTAVPTVEITGQARRGDGPARVDVHPRSGAPTFPVKADGSGSFTIHVARSTPLILIIERDWSLFIEPDVPLGTDTVDIGMVQFDMPMGRIAGSVVSGAGPAPGGTLYAMRTDGTVLKMLFSDGTGRLDGDINAPGPDPVDPEAGIDIPAGEYVFFHYSFDEQWNELAVHKAATQGVAAAEFDALPRVTVPENGRATITIDWDQLTAATRALVEAALGP
jgi:hypothetical protein